MAQRSPHHQLTCKKNEQACAWLAPRSTQRHGEDSKKHGPVTFLPLLGSTGKTTRTLAGTSRKAEVKSTQGGFFFKITLKEV